MTDPDEVIRAAEEVTGILESRGVGAVVEDSPVSGTSSTVFRLVSDS